MQHNERVGAACGYECDRQRVGLGALAGLISAYQMAEVLARLHPLPSEAQAGALARLIEPRTDGRYRITPITFDSGRTALSHREVPDAMMRLFSHLDEDTNPTEFVHAYLDIHPLQDGNGRTAFVLYNWVGGTLDDALALPEMY